MELTDEQWEIVAPLIPELKSGPGKPGRPAQDARGILEASMWVLRTGAPWKDIPGRFPSYQTCHRRFQQWAKEGTLKAILIALRKDLEERGGIDDIEAFIDGTYAGAKKGAHSPGNLVPALRRRSWRLQTALVCQSRSALRLVRSTTSSSSSKRSMTRSSTRSRPS
jgi:transposase